VDERARMPVEALVPIRHARMGATPFTFFRGGAAVMASDLSRTPSTGLRAQLSGDAHLSNFGVFNGADKRSAEVDQMGPKRLARYAQHCGAALALAHARTGDRAAICAYLGDDDTADHVLADFAEHYAEVNERDYAAYQAAIADGRIPVASEA
ncbi:MAG: DUF2252 family protein, partial [Jiangellales bacterium]